MAVSFGIASAVMPASAVELKFCNDIKDGDSRMACLQDHIAALEGEIVALDGELSQLKIDLEQKLNANGAFKVQAATPEQGLCLGPAAQNQPPLMISCDRPDAWRFLGGKAAEVHAKMSPDKETGKDAGTDTGKETGNAVAKAPGNAVAKAPGNAVAKDPGK